ncbi:hypothetical protein KR074_005598 [Drosophila pseudoananassae]|nr:hypothetical protein KR074_005598 [Drosophila pseudoananassae]
MSSVQEKGVNFKDKRMIWNTGIDVQGVIDALDNLPIVHFVNFEGNTLGVEAAQAIGEALKQHPELRHALWRDLFDCRTRTEVLMGLRHLANGLRYGDIHLTVLDLGMNNLGTDGFIGLDAIIRSSACYSLQELRLDNCSLMPHATVMLANSLMQLDKNAKNANTQLKLRIITLGNNLMEVEGCIQMSKAFKVLKSLEIIDLKQNEIFLAGVSDLAEALTENSQLRTFNMNDNALCEGLEDMCLVLPQLKMLREIDLGECLIGNKGAFQLSQALDNHLTHLEFLDLGFNNIWVDGGLAVVKSMKNKANLRYLYLGGNCFGTGGCQRILLEMKKLPTWAALGPFDDDVSEDDEFYVDTSLNDEEATPDGSNADGPRE